MTSHWLHIILIQMTKDTFCDINIRKDCNIFGNQIRKTPANLCERNIQYTYYANKIYAKKPEFGIPMS